LDEPRMPQVIIEAGHTEKQYWRDLWRYRELFYFLAWRDLLVRYKQTFVGVGWSIIRPLLTMIVLTVVFGKLGKMPSGGRPYPLLVLCGMLPWQFYLESILSSNHSTGQQRYHQFCGFLNLCCFPGSPDDLVPVFPACGCAIPSAFCHPDVWGLARCRSVDRRSHG